MRAPPNELDAVKYSDTGHEYYCSYTRGRRFCTPSLTRSPVRIFIFITRAVARRGARIAGVRDAKNVSTSLGGSQWVVLCLVNIFENGQSARRGGGDLCIFHTTRTRTHCPCTGDVYYYYSLYSILLLKTVFVLLDAS